MVDSFDADKTYQRLMHNMASSSELMPEINKDLESLILIHGKEHVYDGELHYLGRIFMEANLHFNKIKFGDCSKYYIKIGLYVKVQKYLTEYQEPMRSTLDRKSQVILMKNLYKLVKRGYYEYYHLNYPNYSEGQSVSNIPITVPNNPELSKKIISEQEHILEEPMSSNNGIWYVVIRGRQPGIYNSWEKAQDQVLGYSNNLHKRFKDFKSAEIFYRQNQSQELIIQK